MLAAAREATVNAAKWSGVQVISIYAEVEATQVSLFVRDRGRGFDPRACRPIARGCPSPCAPGWPATAAPRRSRAFRARAPRSGCPCPRCGGSRTAAASHQPRTAAATSPTPPPCEPSATTGPRVFIVDDHGLFRSGVRSELGNQVEVIGEADDVEPAIAGIAAAEPDVVLLDVHLPGGGGHAVVTALKSTPPAGAIPRALRVRRARGRHRRHPRRRPRLRDQDDLRRGARGRGASGGRRRGGLLAAARRVRARRLRGACPPPTRSDRRSTPSSTS